MFDPVMTSTGVVFEREAIEKWFLTHDSLPDSEAKVNSKALTPVALLQKSIRSAY